MREPLVSVIVNCYNGATYLKQAIDSVESQTYKNWEIIFWDNQSTDGGANIFRKYLDSRHKYFYAPKHTLLYEARNLALEKATGDYIAFLDVDDWWEPEKLTLQMKLFQDDEVGFVCGNFWYVNERRNKTWKRSHKLLPTGYVMNELLGEYFIGLLTLIIRKSALNAMSYKFNPAFHVIGDFDACIRLASRWKLDCVQTPIASYRLHDNNETLKNRQRHIAEFDRWLSDKSILKMLEGASGLKILQQQVEHVRCMNYLLERKKLLALKLFLKQPWGKLKMRQLFAILSPYWLLLRVKI